MVTIVIANSMQFAFYIIPTARKYKQLTSNQLNMNIEKIYKVCERGNFHICTFQISYLSVTLLHNVR